jgi:RNase P/RNase MRP subunit POP5
MAVRVKRRYLLVECATPVVEGGRTRFESVLCSAVLAQVGALRYPAVNPKIAGFVDEHRFVMRASLEGHRELVLALTMIKRLDGAETAFYTLKSSGTIRALLKEGSKAQSRSH